jgi:hypothetical protein
MLAMANSLRRCATMRITAVTTTLRPIALVRPSPAPAGVLLRALHGAAPRGAAQRATKAAAFGGLAAMVAEVARCDDDDDDDDDDEPLTPAQQAHADQIDALHKGAKEVSVTPGMAISVMAGLAMPLAGFIAQGASMSTTLGGLTLSLGVLYSVVGAATQANIKDVQTLIKNAEERKFPSFLFATLAIGLAYPAASTIMRTGHVASTGVATVASVVTTAGLYAVIVSPMMTAADERAASK